MILLRLISWPYFRRHLLRWALTIAGIALGVALFVAMHTANQSVMFAFERTVDRIAGATELQVTAGEAGFDEEVLDRVRAVPAVRVAAPVVEAVVETRLPGQGSVLVLGIDMTGDRSLRTYDLEGGDEAIVDDPLVFLAQPDSIIVTSEFAGRNALRVGSRVPLWTMEGERRFTVRGIMRAGGLAAAFGGNLAVMDVYAAQHVFGRGWRFDRIDVALAPGVSVDQGRQALGQALGPGFEVEPPSSRGRQFEAIIGGYRAGANVSSAFALFIGMFLIYNSFAIAVSDRRREIGILRALGATRRQISRLFLGEGVVAGVTGSLAGMVFGLGLAGGIAEYLGRLFGQLYGVAARAEEVAAAPGLLVTSLGVGIASSLVGAFLPAQSAARIDPLQAVHKGRHQLLSAGENRVRLATALAMAAVAVLCLAFGDSGAAFYAGYFLTVLASLLLAPQLTLALARMLRPVLSLQPVEGALAADSLIQAPRRTSGVVMALMLSLAMAVAFAGIAGASYRSVREFVDAVFNPDFYVTPTEQMANRTYRFPASMEAELAAVPGVRAVQAVRYPRVEVFGTPMTLVAIDLASFARTSRYQVVAGDPDGMYASAARGEGVIVSDNLARLRGLRIGDPIELAAPARALRLPIVGIVVDYSDQQGSVTIDLAVYRREWKDDAVNVFRVFLADGTDAGEAKGRILDRFAGTRRLFVLTSQDVRGYILGVTEQFFGVTWVQLAIATLVAVLGIVTALTVSIIDRRRELAVLRAVGAWRRQVRRTIWIEAVSIGVIGLVLGLGLGAVNLYYTLEMIARDISGVRLDYQFPYGTAALLLPIVLTAAFAGALWPAEAAVRAPLVEGLEYE